MAEILSLCHTIVQGGLSLACTTVLQKELKYSRLKSKTTGASKAAQNKALVTNDDESKFGRTVVRLYTSLTEGT